MRTLLIILFAALTIIGQAQERSSNEKESTIETEQISKARAVAFPDSLQWLNTSYPLTLSDFKDKFLLLSFWTSSSMICTGQLEMLKELNSVHRELAIVIVHSGKYDPERFTHNVRSAVIEHEIPFPVINDSAFTLWDQYGVEAWPTNILINPDQEIVLQSTGVQIKGDIDANIELYDGKTSEIGAVSGNEINTFQQSLLVFPTFIENDGSFSLFISETLGHRIIQTDFNNTFEHSIGTGNKGFKDGDKRIARFNSPHGMAFHPLDSILYIADTGNDAIRAYHMKTGEVSTVMGNGERSLVIPELVVEKSHGLNQPTGLELVGNDLYIAMTGWNQIWKLDTKTGMAVPVAGSGEFGFTDGKDLESTLAEPYGITRDAEGVLYFTELQSSAVRTLKKGKVSTLIGSGIFEYGDIDGKSKDVLIQGPAGIEYYDEMLYVADQYNHKIKAVDPFNGRTETFLGSGKQGYKNGAKSQMEFNFPAGLTVLRDQLFIADKYNHLVRQYDLNEEYIKSYEFSNLDQMQFQSINEFQVFETDTIIIPQGQSTINLKLELGEAWSLIPWAPQSALVSTRNPAILGDPNGVDPNTQTVSFDLENNGEFKHFITEFSLFYQNAEIPDLKYHRTFTLMVLLDFDENAPPEQEVAVDVPSF